ncbi:FAD-dependent oxidoreductase [Desulfovibrio sp. OttesenSCG-928-F07]|nr:FAD-dependent oxidoreductase [Desulfovibrio sp. OttesenSCG-928-F07]
MRAVVVGAGAGGIASAIMLAKRGHDVTLCEAGVRIAPLLRGFSRKGYHFDTGFHCAGTLGKGGALHRYLRMLGLLPHLQLVPMRPECGELYRFFSDSSLDFCLPGTAQAAAEACDKIWPGQKENVLQFFADIKDGFNHSAFTNPAIQGFDIASLQSTMSAEQYIARYNFPQQLKSILLSHVVFMGTLPSELSLSEFSLVSHAMFEDMHYIEGGGKALALAFEKALNAFGVKVLTKATVANFTVAAGKVNSVTLADGRVLDCDACVFTGHPKMLPDMLPQGTLRPSTSAHLRSLQETSASFSIYGTTSSNFVSGRFVYLCPTDNVEDVFTAHKNDKSWVTISTTSQYPDGKYAVVVTANLPNGISTYCSLPESAKSVKRPQDYAELKQQAENWLVARLKTMAPELNDFELICSSTEYTMRDWVYGSTGSIYGVLHSLKQMPVLPRTKLENLVVAGQATVLPGLLGVFVSAAVAVGMLTGFEDIFEDFRNGKA